METSIGIAVVGAGASGLMAALTAARAGAQVTVIEKNTVPGKKLSATGNGRCNLTNRNMGRQFYSGDEVFVTRVLDSFGVDEELAFFEALGLVLKTDPDGRVFPVCERATAVTSVLELALEEAGGKLLAAAAVESIRKTDGKFTLALSNGNSLRADSVVLACGSHAHPQLGGSEAGNLLATGFGHKLKKPIPVLVPLLVRQKGIARLQGIRVNAELSAFSESRELCRANGELLFTAYGISGPCAINLSAGVVPVLMENRPVTVKMNLFPGKTTEDLAEFMTARRNSLPDRKIKRFFTGWLHETLSNLLIDFIGVEKNKTAAELSANEIAHLAKTLCGWEFDITGSGSWREAMCACGGVETSTIDPDTMQSLLEPGLYITGELLDVNGLCGGYNLHFAWATGRLAGKNAAR
ncbi:MAG: aminoacetone oxidase family FAD-binding enzyme [Elusimicrobiaceae bacterium]|nr:aminoacetone oxidase family FAD-binding enzyme [Elusimicrobiaceae bacterium]